MKKLCTLLKNESGATAIEYGFIIAMIVVGIVVSVQAIGVQVAAPLTTASHAINSR